LMAGKAGIELVENPDVMSAELLVRMTTDMPRRPEDPRTDVLARSRQLGIDDSERVERVASQIELAGLAERRVDDSVACLVLEDLAGRTRVHVSLTIGSFENALADGCIQSYAQAWILRLASALGLTVESIDGE
jgi:hypothetical protein